MSFVVAFDLLHGGGWLLFDMASLRFMDFLATARPPLWCRVGVEGWHGVLTLGVWLLLHMWVRRHLPPGRVCW